MDGVPMRADEADLGFIRHSRGQAAEAPDHIGTRAIAAAREPGVCRDAADLASAPDGQVELYAYAPQLGGWLYLGWVKQSWDGSGAPTMALARYGNGESVGELTSAFFDRGGVGGRGLGCLLFLPAPDGCEDAARQLISLEIDICTDQLKLRARDQEPVPLERLLAAIRPDLLVASAGPAQAALKSALLLRGESAPNRFSLRKLAIGGGAALTGAAGIGSSHGHVDFYGYHAGSAAWFFCGWVSAPWAEDDKPAGAAAQFENGLASSEASLAAFYYRDDIGDCGVGFILALPCAESGRNHLVSLKLKFAASSMSLSAMTAGAGLTEQELIGWLGPLLSGSETRSNRARLRSMLLPAKPDADSHPTPRGFVDFYGYHAIAGGWLFCGWISRDVEEHATMTVVKARFERGEVHGEAVRLHYLRDDLGDAGMGFVLFVSGTGTPLGGLLSVRIETGDAACRIYPGATIQRLREQELITELRKIAASAPPSGQREVMLATLIERPAMLAVLRAVLDDNPLVLNVEICMRDTPLVQPSAENRLPSPAECLALAIPAAGQDMAVEIVRDSHRLPEYTASGISRWESDQAHAGIELAAQSQGVITRYDVPVGAIAIIGPGTIYRLCCADGADALKLCCVPSRAMPMTLAIDGNRGETVRRSGVRVFV
jgi:hypothetical protein